MIKYLLSASGKALPHRRSIQSTSSTASRNREDASTSANNSFGGGSISSRRARRVKADARCVENMFNCSAGKRPCLAVNRSTARCAMSAASGVTTPPSIKILNRSFKPFTLNTPIYRILYNNGKKTLSSHILFPAARQKTGGECVSFTAQGHPPSIAGETAALFHILLYGPNPVHRKIGQPLFHDLSLLLIDNQNCLAHLLGKFPGPFRPKRPASEPIGVPELVLVPDGGIDFSFLQHVEQLHVVHFDQFHIQTAALIGRKEILIRRGKIDADAHPVADGRFAGIGKENFVTGYVAAGTQPLHDVQSRTLLFVQFRRQTGNHRKIVPARLQGVDAMG